MKKLFGLLLVLLASCGRTAENQIKSNIENSKTASHVNIPGTRLYVVPPPKFHIVHYFVGLQSNDSASAIIVSDKIGTDFYKETADSSVQQRFKGKAIIFDRKEITVNGYSGQYYCIGQPGLKAYLVLFGDATFATSVSAYYNDTDEAARNGMFKFFNSICYDKDKKIDPLDLASFSLDERVSRFAFEQFKAELYFFSDSDIESRKNENRAEFIVREYQRDSTTNLESTAKKAYAQFQSNYPGFKEYKAEKYPTSTLNGYDCFEQVIHGQMDKKEMLLYYCLVADDNMFLLMWGMAGEDMENTRREFEKLAHSVKLKR